MKKTTTNRFTVGTVAVLLLGFTFNPANAQTVRWIGGTGSWTTGANWDIDGFNYPDALFDGLAVIDNGGTAQVTGVVGQDSPAISLGDGSGLSGSLILTGATSNLNVVAGGGSTGNVGVGANGGTGTLNISDGTLAIAGQLSSATNAAPATQITLSGSSTISMGSAFLDKVLRIEGPAVNFSATGDVVLGQAGTHTWQIAGGASTMNIGGQLDLGGTLRVEFPSTPMVGGSWNLADSASVINGFGNIDASTVTGLGNGETFAVQTTPGGTNGQLTQLVLEQHPVLTVNRQTGRTKIENLGSSNTINFDAYAITSQLGTLNPTNWESLQSNSVGSWVEANPGPTALSELNVVGSSSLGGASEFDLGTPFELPTPTVFGEQTEDLVFRYAKPTGGFIEGEVRYEGRPNNTFVLNVDPTTGQSHLYNASSFTVPMDAYTISSATGSLQFADGTWNSLDDQNADDGSWAESNPSDFRISELQTIGATTLTPGASFDLGDLFDITGERDLVFEFALSTENFFRRGIVTYGAFAATPSGDFNGDTNWDCADIDALVAAIAGMSTDLSFDMNGDQMITLADITDPGTGWLAVGGANNPAQTGGNAFIVGDADLDGDVDGDDFAAWDGSKFTATPEWCSGDFNADGLINGRDFLLWNANKFTSSDSVSAVPEPISPTVWLLSVCLVGLHRRLRTL